MIKITGLDKMTRDLDEATKALSELDGELGSVRFDPHDPESIEGAVQAMEQMIDDRLGEHSSNPIVGPLAEQMKERYREAILDKAAAARVEGESE